MSDENDTSHNGPQEARQYLSGLRAEDLWKEISKMEADLMALRVLHRAAVARERPRKRRKSRAKEAAETE